MENTKRPVGRPRKYSDEDLLNAIRNGATTAAEILEAVGAKHKTTLFDRLMTLEYQGLIKLDVPTGPRPIRVRLVESDEDDVHTSDTDASVAAD